MSSPLKLSVVLLIPDHYSTVSRTLAHLRAQTVRHQLEVILVTPSADDIDLIEEELSCFGAWQVIEIEDMATSGPARAEGVRQATAPIVAFTEDHSFPEPEWAEALLEAHRRDRTMVAPVIVNGNPRTMTSWASLFLSFGPYVGHTTPTELGHGPWHNSAYQRDVLLSYGYELDELLDVEGLLHDGLRARGHELWIEPAARTHHLNFSHPGWFAVEQFINGRHYASARARSWSPGKRLLYTLGGPLIPFVRFRQVMRELRRSGRDRDLWPALLPVLALGLVLYGLGEMAGYALGPGAAPYQKFDSEFNKDRFMIEADRETLSAQTASRYHAPIASHVSSV